MRNYNCLKYSVFLDQLIKQERVVIETDMRAEEFSLLQYFLTFNSYYAVIVDDYSYPIVSKESLLEALYYQLRLITVHDLNWDAIDEGLFDAQEHFSDFRGICLLFKKGNELKTNLSNELNTLIGLLLEINAKRTRIPIVLIMSCDENSKF